MHFFCGIVQPRRTVNRLTALLPQAFGQETVWSLPTCADKQSYTIRDSERLFARNCSSSVAFGSSNILALHLIVFCLLPQQYINGCRLSIGLLQSILPTPLMFTPAQPRTRIARMPSITNHVLYLAVSCFSMLNHTMPVSISAGSAIAASLKPAKATAILDTHLGCFLSDLLYLSHHESFFSLSSWDRRHIGIRSCANLKYSTPNRVYRTLECLEAASCPR